MLRLSDDQLAHIQDICRVVAPTRRGAFLELLAVRLRGVELGDGSLHRVAAATLREFVQRGGGARWIDGAEDEAG